MLPSTQFGNLKHPDQEPRPIPGGWAGPTFHRVTKSRQGELVGSQPTCPFVWSQDRLLFQKKSLQQTEGTSRF